VGGATEAAEQQSSGEAGQQASRSAAAHVVGPVAVQQWDCGTVGLCHTATVEYGSRNNSLFSSSAWDIWILDVRWSVTTDHRPLTDHWPRKALPCPVR